MKRILLLVLLLMSLNVAHATHIVGGEFEFNFVGVDGQNFHRYNLGMVLYFDFIHGAAGAEDGFVYVSIYRKRDNAVMAKDIMLSLVSKTRVQYKRPNCGSEESIVTNRLYYTYTFDGVNSANLLFNPAMFDDPEGYYIAWERCCRNYSIVNIYSSDPGEGIYAGQTFYLEFPPMIKNGAPFFNSAPRLFKPLSDYACKGRLYTADFRGTDPDGDSLAYSMTVPLNTHSGEPVPAMRPAPYPLVKYRPGFSSTDVMHGKPDLSITEDGILNVVPTLAGLFVFAVKVEEFRDGVKIGEVRRDFQLLVLANCPLANPPLVEGKTRSATAYVTNKLTVAFPQNTPDDQRCIDIRVTDPDAGSQSEDIEILAIAVNFKKKELGSEILPPNPTAVLQNGNAATFSVCFPQCPYKLDTYLIDIVARNESCGGSLMDTIRLEIKVEIPPNNVPVWNPQAVTNTVTEGGTPYKVTFVGTDADNDNLTVTPPLFATEFSKYGLAWKTVENIPGKVTNELTWNTECDLYDFSKKRDFKFAFILDDQDVCDLTPDDTLVFDLKRRIPDFHDPEIKYEPNTSLKKINLERKIYTTIDFNTLISDADDDKLEVTGVGKDFSLADYGASYPDATLTGTTSIPTSKPFTWPLNCDKIKLDQKDVFNFYLIVTDKYNSCNYYLADTLDVTLKVLPPDFHKPELSIKGSTEAIKETITVRDKLSVPVVATDTDVNPQDNMQLELMSVQSTGPLSSYSFEPVSGTSPLTGVLTWTPDCDIYQGMDASVPLVGNFKFTFVVVDDRCYVDEANRKDTLSLFVDVRDIEREEDFLPPNVFTPSKDDKNEFFAMMKYDEDTKSFVSILPDDNCAEKFLNVTIMNRWGRVVFESDDRDFRWYGDGENSGVYFYLMRFTRHEYKGTVSVITGGGSQSNR